MSKKQENGTFIHGIAASEHIDSSGERIIISGVDISSLTKDGVFNYEHKSDTAGSIVGKILEAKKILKKEDCENEYHKYFWNKVKMPFIYVAGELFDSVGHGSAKDVAAMLKYDKNLNKEETKALVNFSIEGSRLKKDGSNILKCIARKVTVTITPCNKMAQAEQMDSPSQGTKDSGGIDISKEILSKFKKSESIEIEIVKGELKYYTGLYNKKQSKFNPENKPSSKADFKPQTPSSGEPKRSASPLPKPKREFSPSNAPDKIRVGDRISYRNKKKAKTGAQIYNDPKTWEKSEKKSVEQTKIDPKKKKKSKKSFYTSNVRKAITASVGVGAPSTRTQGAALQKEDLNSKISWTPPGKRDTSQPKLKGYGKPLSTDTKKINRKADAEKAAKERRRKLKEQGVLKSLSEDSWKNYQYKDELIEFITEKQPKMNKNEVLAVSKTYSYLEQVKLEKKLEDA